MRIIHLADIAPEAWRNGAGETRPLWSDDYPVRGRHGFTRRISVATLAAPAPFSSLPGIDRTFLPLDDVGIEFEVDGRPMALAQLCPVRFAGETRVRLTGLDQPGRALNIMTDRRYWRHVLAVGSTSEPGDALIMLGHTEFGGQRLALGDLLMASSPLPTLAAAAATVRFDRTCES